MPDPKQNLIRILQNAHAGEQAAAYAYRGHWKSVNDKEQSERIKQIEEEEWDHRKRVRAWLNKLEAEPKPLREKVFLDDWSSARSLMFCFGLVLPDVFCRTAREPKYPGIP